MRHTLPQTDGYHQRFGFALSLSRETRCFPSKFFKCRGLSNPESYFPPKKKRKISQEPGKHIEGKILVSPLLRPHGGKVALGETHTQASPISREINWGDCCRWWNMMIMSCFCLFSLQITLHSSINGGGQVLGIVGTWPEDSEIHKFDPPSILPPC